MPEPIRRVIVPPPDFPSPKAGTYFAQMEDQTRRLLEDTRGATPGELEWQSAPGMNTIGMLLAHIAVVEMAWMSVLAGTSFECQQVLGIGPDDDGLPLPEGAPPAPLLAGKDLTFFEDLLARARANTRLKLLAMSDEQVDRTFERPPPRHMFLNGHWILYHLVEHQAGHDYQVNLLRHLYRIHAGDAVAEPA